MVKIAPKVEEVKNQNSKLPPKPQGQNVNYKLPPRPSLGQAEHINAIEPKQPPKNV